MVADADATLSKFMSFVLRHKPDAIGLALDPEGWAWIEELVSKSNTAGTLCTREDVLRVIETSEKKRFTLSADGDYVRAAQGHSIAINLGLEPREPPAVLYHGTAKRFLAAIRSEGLKPRSRQHVHLSADDATARVVGQRHGSPVVLTVQARRMHDEGSRFFVADNGVWLTDRVPPEFLGSDEE